MKVLLLLLLLYRVPVTGGACCNCYNYEGDGGVCRVNIGLLSTPGFPVNCCCGSVELKVAGTALVTSCGDFSPPDHSDCKRCSPPPPAPCCDCSKHGGVASSGSFDDNLAPICCLNHMISNYGEGVSVCPVSKICKVCKPTKPKPTHKRKPTKKPTRKPTKKPTHKPTKKPTHRPTPWPATKKPTHKPTKKPTHKPTPRPVTKTQFGPIVYDDSYPGGTVSMIWNNTNPVTSSFVEPQVLSGHADPSVPSGIVFPVSIAITFKQRLPTSLYSFAAPAPGSIVGISGAAEAKECNDCGGAFVISVRLNNVEIIPPTNNFPLPGRGSAQFSTNSHKFSRGDVLSVYIGASRVSSLLSAYAWLTFEWKYATLGPLGYDSNYPGGTVYMGTFAAKTSGSIVGISGTAGANVQSCECAFVISVRINGAEVIPPTINLPLGTYAQPGIGYTAFTDNTIQFSKGDIIAVYFGASKAVHIKALAWLTVLPASASNTGRRMLEYSNNTAAKFFTLQQQMSALV